MRERPELADGLQRDLDLARDAAVAGCLVRHQRRLRAPLTGALPLGQRASLAGRGVSPRMNAPHFSQAPRSVGWAAAVVETSELPAAPLLDARAADPHAAFLHGLGGDLHRRLRFAPRIT